MDKAKMLCGIINELKKEFKSVVIAELEGNYCAAADIAVADNKEVIEVYRIAVLKHKN